MPRPASGPAPGKVYPLGLVGESNFQPAIRKARAGEPVLICHEPENSHDPNALRVETTAGAVLGYIAKDSWLRDAIFVSKRGCVASIKSIAGNPGKLGVVIDVLLTDAELTRRGESPQQAASSPSNPMGRFLAGIFKGLR